jgi:hypothetical protein
VSVDFFDNTGIELILGAEKVPYRYCFQMDMDDPPTPVPTARAFGAVPAVNAEKRAATRPLLFRANAGAAGLRILEFPSGVRIGS